MTLRVLIIAEIFESKGITKDQEVHVPGSIVKIVIHVKYIPRFTSV